MNQEVPTASRRWGEEVPPASCRWGKEVPLASCRWGPILREALSQPPPEPIDYGLQAFT